MSQRADLLGLGITGMRLKKWEKNQNRLKWGEFVERMW
jgi:hypothetical protein